MKALNACALFLLHVYIIVNLFNYYMKIDELYLLPTQEGQISAIDGDLMIFILDLWSANSSQRMNELQRSKPLSV